MYTAFSRSDKPSIVTTDLPSNWDNLVTQAFAFFPSIITVHVPQAPALQPSLVPVNFKSALKKSIKR